MNALLLALAAGVPWVNLGKETPVIGDLGHPLGTVLEVEGPVTAAGIKADPSVIVYQLTPDKLGGKAFRGKAQPILLGQFKASDAPPAWAKSKRVSVTGFETGHFYGRPAALLKPQPDVPAARIVSEDEFEFGFQVTFEISKIKALP